MAQNVIAGDLCTVNWSADGVAWTEIPGCKTVGIPEETQEYRDRTSLDSPGRNREWGTGLTDTGELTLNCYYSTALYEQALAYKAAGKPVYFQVVLPPEDGVQSTGDEFDYQAFLNPSIPAVDQDGDLMTDLKLRPTGLVNWTKGDPVV